MNEIRPLSFHADQDDEVSVWFATHDATELNLEPVEGVWVKKRRTKDLESLTIRIATEDMLQLKYLADEYGVGHTTIARMLLHRELKDPRPLVNTQP